MATKVQTQCIAIAIKANKLELACYLALCSSVERQYANIDNAYGLVKSAVTPAQWSGYLSSLTKQGKYIPCSDSDYRGHWGEVV